MPTTASDSVGIAVMAKAPRAGSCKTRLVPMLSPEHAAAMSAAFLGDVTENLMLAAQSAPIAPYVAYAPADAAPAFEGLIAPGTNLLLADGSAPASPGVAGFGKCLLHAIDALLRRGHRAACVLNSDSPNLPTRVLVRAADLLLRPRDHVIIGPAEDGGYYFLGMRAAHAGLFAGIDWSTSRVAAQTRQRSASLGLPIIELEPWYDVDDPASLRRLLRALPRGAGSGEFEAPRTHAKAKSLGLLAGQLRNEAAAHWAGALGAIS
jgi:rSAM/selenodomain-associated transferase 1